MILYIRDRQLWDGARAEEAHRDGPERIRKKIPVSPGDDGALVVLVVDDYGSLKREQVVDDEGQDADHEPGRKRVQESVIARLPAEQPSRAVEQEQTAGQKGDVVAGDGPGDRGARHNGSNPR